MKKRKIFFIMFFIQTSQMIYSAETNVSQEEETLEKTTIKRYIGFGHHSINQIASYCKDMIFLEISIKSNTFCPYFFKFASEETFYFVWGVKKENPFLTEYEKQEATSKIINALKENSISRKYVPALIMLTSFRWSLDEPRVPKSFCHYF